MHDKTYKIACAPSKDSISLGIRPIWSEFSLCAQWVAKDPRFLHADSEDSDQTGWMPRLIWIFGGRTCHFVGFVMLWLTCGYSLEVPWWGKLVSTHMFSWRNKKHTNTLRLKVLYQLLSKCQALFFTKIKKKKLFQHFAPIFLVWTLPSLNFNVSTVTNTSASQKSNTEWQTLQFLMWWLHIGKKGLKCHLEKQEIANKQCLLDTPVTDRGMDG